MTHRIAVVHVLQSLSNPIFIFVADDKISTDLQRYAVLLPGDFDLSLNKHSPDGGIGLKILVK